MTRHRQGVGASWSARRHRSLGAAARSRQPPIVCGAASCSATMPNRTDGSGSQVRYRPLDLVCKAAYDRRVPTPPEAANLGGRVDRREAMRQVFDDLDGLEVTLASEPSQAVARLWQYAGVRWRVDAAATRFCHCSPH